MITLKDISKESGYSVSTVSKALNGSSEIGVKTTLLIQRIAEEMGYFPNAAARVLKTNKSNNLGVLFVDEMQSGLAHEYFSSVLNSFKVEAERLGFDITFTAKTWANRKCPITNTLDIATATESHRFSRFPRPQSRRASTKRNSYRHHRPHLQRFHRHPLDNLNGARDLVQHVYDCGHRKIAFIHGEILSNAKTNGRLLKLVKS